MSIVYTLIILCVLIVGHEFGHFIVAKLCGIYVQEFSLGMGPKLLQWGRHETRYSVRLFPIGGYVRMVGEDESSSDPRAFCNKKIWQRIAVVFCGPLMNFILASVLFLVAFMYFGVGAPDPLIGTVEPGSPAAVAGIAEGDLILSIDGAEVTDWQELSAAIQAGGGAEMTVRALRADGTEYTASLSPVYNEEQGRMMIGIMQAPVRLAPWQSFKQGWVYTYDFTINLLVSLWQMLTGAIPVDVAGPVGMVNIVGNYASANLMSLFLLAGILSINLGVINLFPFPGLDGSRIIFLLIEAVRRKPVPADKEAMVHFIGIVCLMILMVMITVNDVQRLVGG